VAGRRPARHRLFVVFYWGGKELGFYRLSLAGLVYSDSGFIVKSSMETAIAESKANNKSLTPSRPFTLDGNTKWGRLGGLMK